IGEADLVGHGIGTAMMRAFLGRLFTTTDAPRAIIDPDPANTAAVRCYQKAGFRPIELRNTPFGQTLLMAQDRPTAQDRPNKKESVAA
ncbi:MAG: GNAT family N-acetyltransferase, partial [Pseudomonadota bacterium]